MALRVASAAAALRDAESVQRIAALVHSAAEAVSGARVSRVWRDELVVAARAAFYLATYGRGVTSPGEEYAGTALADARSEKAPSRTRRTLFAVLNALAPYIGARLVRYITRWLDKQLALASNKPARLRRLRKLHSAWRVFEALVSRLPTAHLALFFLEGVFATLSQRLCRLRPVPQTTASFSAASGARNSARLLAAMLGAQLALEAGAYAWQYWVQRGAKDGVYAMLAAMPTTSTLKTDSSDGTVHDDGDDDDDAEANLAQRCALCLGPRKHVSAIECGHLFCWSCIQEWLAEADACPVCRERASARGVVRLWNWQ